MIILFSEPNILFILPSLIKSQEFKETLIKIFKQGHSVSNPDPFHFGQPDPFHETDPGSKKSAKIMENFHKNQPKSQDYYLFFSKNIKLLLTDINIYLINNKTNHFCEKYIFDRIFLSIFGKAGSGSVILRNGSEDPDPYQNETDPKHCNDESSIGAIYNFSYEFRKNRKSIRGTSRY